MSNSKVSITGKQLLIVFFMGLAFAVVYATPFEIGRASYWERV